MTDPQAQKILDMIEAVDPEDTDKLDEIDARVCAWLHHEPYFSHRVSDGWNQYGIPINARLFTKSPSEQPNGFSMVAPYTRSLNVIKANQPEGYAIYCAGEDPSWKADLIRTKAEGSVDCFSVRDMPTEELARLYVVIDAIAHERGQK